MKFEQVYQLVVMSCGLILSIAGVGCIVVGSLLDNDSQIQSINDARSRTYNTQYWLGLPLIVYGIKSMVLAISQKGKMNIFSLLVSIPLIALTLVGAILHGTSYAHFLSMERKQNYLEDLDYICVTNNVNQCRCRINQQNVLQPDNDQFIVLPVQCGEQGTLVAFHGAIFALGIICFALVFGIVIINIISLFNKFTSHFQPANTPSVENRGFSQQEGSNGHAIPHEVDQSQNGLHLSQQQLNTSHNDATPSSPSDELPPSYESLLTTFHVTNGVMNIGTSPFFHRSLPEVNRHARVEYRGEASSDTDAFHLGGSGGGASGGGRSGGGGSGGGDSGGGDSGGGGSGSGGGGSGGGSSGGGGSGGGDSGGGDSGGGGSGGGDSGGGGNEGGANGGGHGSEGGGRGGGTSGGGGGDTGRGGGDTGRGGGGSGGGTSGGGGGDSSGSGGGGSEGGTSGGGDSGRGGGESEGGESGGGGRGGGRSRSGASGGSGTSGGGGRSRGIPQREYSLININEAMTDDGENNAEPGTHGFSEHNSPTNSEMQVIIDIPQTSRNNTSNHSAAVHYRGQLDSSSRNVWTEQQSSQGTTAQNSTNLTTNENRENDVDHQIHSAEISPEDSSDSAVISGSVVTEQLLALERTPQDINTDLATISERDIEHQLASQEPWLQDSTELVTVPELQNINNGQEMSQDRSDLERTAENYVEQIDFETERTEYGGAGMLQEENSVTSDVVVRELNIENSGVLLPVDDQERPMGVQEVDDVNSPDLLCEPTETSHVDVVRQKGVFSQHQPQSASSSSLPSVTNMGEPSTSGPSFPARHTREMARKSTTHKILLDIIRI